MFWLEIKAFGECIRAHRVHVFPKSPLPLRRGRGEAEGWGRAVANQSGATGSGVRCVFTDMVLDAALLDFCCLLSQAYLMLSHGASRGKGVTQGLPSP